MKREVKPPRMMYTKCGLVTSRCSQAMVMGYWRGDVGTQGPRLCSCALIYGGGVLLRIGTDGGCWGFTGWCRVERPNQSSSVLQRCDVLDTCRRGGEKKRNKTGFLLGVSCLRLCLCPVLCCPIFDFFGVAGVMTRSRSELDRNFCLLRGTWLISATRLSEDRESWTS